MVTGPRILVVDDDPTVSDVVHRYFDKAGMSVQVAADGNAALEIAARWLPDLVVLDLMLPGMGGLAVCRALRETRDVPVIMLTALGEESDRVLGLEQGADDYLTKPFSPRELVLRVQSILRRAAGPEASELLTDGEIVVDSAARQATRDGALLALTMREFELLTFFLRHPHQAFDRAQLLEQVWGWTFGDSATVTVHVRRLREKIEIDAAAPTRIITVWGVGYRYEPVPAGAAAGHT
ncbi:MAG: response regulator transcription factor [Geodermatophilaceae bacterium]|nr:response regulator transcription factor [Geodermatophilaceae bacterium]